MIGRFPAFVHSGVVRGCQAGFYLASSGFYLTSVPLGLLRGCRNRNIFMHVKEDLIRKSQQCSNDEKGGISP